MSFYLIRMRRNRRAELFADYTVDELLEYRCEL